jgi:hypothetical protein
MRSIVGDEVDYYVSVISDGAASNVSLEMNLPAGIDFRSAHIHYPEVRQLTPTGNRFDLGSYAGPYSEVVHIKGVITAPGKFVSQMKVSTSSAERTLRDNTSEITFCAAPQNAPETTVTHLSQGSKHLRLTFSAPLDPESVQHNIRFGLIKTRPSTQLKIKSIIYDPNTLTVTLYTRERLPSKYLLTVTGLFDANMKEVAPFTHRS